MKGQELICVHLECVAAKLPRSKNTLATINLADDVRLNLGHPKNISQGEKNVKKI